MFEKIHADSLEAHAYTAGFLDGEGCFLIGSTSITVKVGHTHLPSLHRLERLYGGQVLPRSGTKKPAYTWAVHGRTASRLLVLILPFLYEKKPQAELMLEFYQTIGPRGGKILEAVQEHRRKLKESVSEYKRRTY